MGAADEVRVRTYAVSSVRGYAVANAIFIAGILAGQIATKSRGGKIVGCSSYVRLSKVQNLDIAEGHGITATLRGT